jgi:AhpD family alkylhydroperoxidase
MELHDFDNQRRELMDLLKSSDPFFKEFGAIDDRAFDDGCIPKKYKELTMITVSIATHCEACATFHAGEAVYAGASTPELKEAIIMGLMSGGSLCYPLARHTLSIVMELNKNMSNT